MSKRLDKRILTFKQCLMNIDWQVLYLLDNANDSYDHFIQVFTDLYNECFPVVQVTIKKKCNKPWITHGLLKSINRKHKLYNNYVKKR